MRKLAVTLGLVVVPLATACSTLTPQERGPAIVASGHGPITERVQTQVNVVDAKLSAVEQLCTGESGKVEGRCLGPLHELRKKKAYYRQRANALLKTTGTDTLEEVTEWQELEIELELLTSEVNELADDVKHAG